MISAEKIRSLLDYDPDTGDFLWKDGARKKYDKSKVNKAGHVGFHGYVLWKYQNKMYRMHRIAWLYVYGSFPDADIDHINGIRHDNRIANLRKISRSGNLENLHKATSKSRSGILGVCFDKKSQKWRAFICVKGKRYSLGTHATSEAASAAYMDAKRSMHEACTI